MIHILKWIWSYNNYLIRSLTERPTNTSHRIGQFSALQKNISPIAIALERESGISRDLVHLSSYYSYAITCWLATMILIFIWAVLVLDVENCISGIEFLVWQSHVLVASIHRYFSNDQLRQIKLQKYEERRVVIIDNKQEKKKKRRGAYTSNARIWNEECKLKVYTNPVIFSKLWFLHLRKENTSLTTVLDY